METRPFGKMGDGRIVTLYTITNAQNASVSVTNLGATLVSIVLQDKNEKFRDVVLGYDCAEDYLAGTTYFGAVIGRSGNRIEHGTFTINGNTYQLDINDNDNNLHSGKNGFESRLWETEEVTENSVRFAIRDADGQQGYPGNFQASVTYTLTDDNKLYLHYKGTCDQDTVANMTNHVYFNLAGHDSGSIENQELMLTAESYTPVADSRAIPTGEIAPVKGTPMDFTTAKKFGRDIGADFEQLKLVGGYDHNYVIKSDKGAVEKFAEAYSPESGICLEAYTDLPGVQLYTGNFIEHEKGKNGIVYTKRHGFCLETQYFPNSINQEGFAKPLLKAGEEYDTVTCYKFSGK